MPIETSEVRSQKPAIDDPSITIILLITLIVILTFELAKTKIELKQANDTITALQQAGENIRDYERSRNQLPPHSSQHP